MVVVMGFGERVGFWGGGEGVKRAWRNVIVAGRWGVVNAEVTLPGAGGGVVGAGFEVSIVGRDNSGGRFEGTGRGYGRVRLTAWLAL